MPWSTDELKRRFARPQNTELLRFLERESPSAHSDLGILVFEAAERLPGAQVFGPNATACSYVFAHTESGVAFLVAVSMINLIFRLPRPEPETRPFEKIGPGWHEIDPFDPARGRARNAELVSALARAAFEHASRL